MAVQIVKAPFKRITKRKGLSGLNLGGRFALPSEFDSNKLASSFVPEGNEVLAAQDTQPLQGTEYEAEGWTIWHYPDEALDAKGKRLGKHPRAGQPHKVTGIGKDGVTYVLMCRDQEVQTEVNRAFGEASRKLFKQELEGQTITAAPQDPGMISEEALTRVLGKEGADEFEAPYAMHGGLPASGTIRKIPTKL